MIPALLSTHNDCITHETSFTRHQVTFTEKVSQTLATYLSFSRGYSDLLISILLEKLPIKFHYVAPLKESSGDEIGYTNLHTQKPSVPACDISQKTQRKNDVPEYVIDHGILNDTSFFNLL